MEAFNTKVIGQVDDADDPDDTKSLDHVRIPGTSRGAASLPTTGSEAGAHVAASMAWKLEQQGYVVNMAIANTGGVRADIIAGEDGLTAGYIIGTLLPFGNEVALVSLTGTEVRELLEATINYSISTSTGAFPTTANLQYTYNGTAIEGNRIENLKVCPGGVDITASTCVDIVDDTAYGVATTSYLLSGKDGYSLFIGKESTNSGFKDNQAMIDYVEAMGTLNEIPTGLTYIPADSSKVDNPLLKAAD